MNFNSIKADLKYKFLSQFSLRDLRISAAVKGNSGKRPPIVKKPKSFVIQDLKMWKVAVEAATDPENPDRSLLSENYDSILLDNHLSSVIDSRILRVVRSKFKLTNEKGEDIPELSVLFEKRWFIQFITEAMWSVFKGTSLLDMFELDENMHLKEISTVPAQNVNTVKGLILKEPGDQQGWPYKEGMLANYYMQLGGDFDIGILSSVAPVALYKKYALGSWLNFTEKFGVPARWVTTDSYDEKRQEELGEMMDNMIDSAWAVLQGNEKIEIAKAPGTDAYNVFKELISTSNSEMSKRILGQDGTTDNKDATGTYGSLKVLEAVADDRHEADRTFIKYLINDLLIPKLLLISPVYSPLVNARFDWDDYKEMSRGEIIEAVDKLSNNYNIDTKYITEKTGIPVTEKYNNDPSVIEGQKKKVVSKVNAQISAMYADRGVEIYNITAAANSVLDKQFAKLVRSIYDKANKAVPVNFYLATAEYLSTALNGKEVKKVTAASGRIGEKNEAFHAQLRNNIFKFSAAKTYAQVQELTGLLTDEKGELKPFHKFKDDANALHYKYNKNWLKTEYNQAVKTAHMAEKWQSFEEDKDLYDLQYDTAGDSNVRPEHKRWNRITRSVDDPFWKKHLPPNDWGCRCTVRKVAKGTPITPEEKLKGIGKPPKAFQFNAGKQKLIFSEEHPYYEVAGNNRELQAEKDYGLPSIATIYKRDFHVDYSISKLNNKEAAYNWWDTIRKGKDSITIKAKVAGKYININIDSKTIEHILEDNNDNRYEWINEIINVLKNPYEVWNLNYKSFPTYRFVKLYKNTKTVVNVELGDTVKVRTAYEMKDPTNERVGVLMQTKK